MIRTILIAAGALAVLSAPTFAAQYYISLDTYKENCSIVSAKPDGKRYHQIGKTAFRSKVEAKKALRVAGSCWPSE